jgi:hypothetical protein
MAGHRARRHYRLAPVVTTLIGAEALAQLRGQNQQQQPKRLVPLPSAGVRLPHARRM